VSAPLIWILAPFGVAVVLWVLQRKVLLVAWVGLVLCVGLAVLAAFVPIGERIPGVGLRIEPEMIVLSRRLLVENADRPLLVFFYGIGAFWFGGSRAGRANRLVTPVGLAVLAILLGALSVEPFLYAALLVETAVLLSVPMLVPAGARAGQGVLRYVVFQTLALPFILTAAWGLSGVEANPTNTDLAQLSVVLLGLGFAFWLAIFPFYTWLPLLAGQAQPYAVGFLTMVMPTAVLILGLNLLGQYGWLTGDPGLFTVFRLSGGIMVVTAGVWAAFQRDVGRLLGYGVIIETGYSLLALSLQDSLGMEIFVMMFLPRLLGLGLWSLSAGILQRETGSLQFKQLERAAEKLPFATAGLAVAYLSLAGLPLLGSFPLRQVLLQEVARTSPFGVVWVLGGSLGLMFGAFRLLAVLTEGYFGPRKAQESRLQMVLLLVGVLSLLLMGVFPRALLPWMTRLLEAISGLS